MPSIRALCLAVMAAGAIVGATPVIAQTAPPIRTGLWEINGETGSAGGPTTSAMERLRKLPPEARQRMAQRGINLTEDGRLRVCLDRKALDSDAWQGRSDCTTDYSQRSSSVWKWRSTCPRVTVEGVARFAGPERYSVKTVVTTERQGRQVTGETNVQAKWIGADCGGIKPLASAGAKP